MERLGGFQMRPINHARFVRPHAFASCICAIAVIVLVGGCSSSSGKAPQIAPNSNGEVTTDPQVRDALATACFDCHSNQTPAAWNARLAPSYVFGVDKARQVLNFSDWPTFGVQRKRAELEAISKVVADGSMPPRDYDFVHPGAQLSDEQKHILLQWLSRQTAPAH
jgi:hypothetical protein